ncbi:thiamine-phosphate kinase [Entomobacter blattae]|uniref:Thiamine-monophosphate kinase n=1 Tax=Entomobacter blattae TaxID=2762277 RepID=A0A7H1NSZ1_9PROT|nr:thiamine-phosphate kinase [Entomobacter blattae]QNT78901.1 Thiamine-monophosphate kinase [Entomobacter blattae]
MVELSKEFVFIEKNFRSLAGEGALGLKDDAAIVKISAGDELVVSADAMVEGVHFFSSDPPDTVGQKLLRCNLSDMAAMGATPLGYLLTISRPPHISEEWFELFCEGLRRDQETYKIFLLGGDTTRTEGNLVLSLTILGTVTQGLSVKRTGAQEGDELWVTGIIGDSALGLKALLNELEESTGYFVNRYRLPQPRVGLPIAGLAHVAMDVSDGLIQDAGHLVRANQLGVTIELEKIPFSQQARSLSSAWLETCLTGGDDYELLIGISPKNSKQLQEISHRMNIPVTQIGFFTAKHTSVKIINKEGHEMKFSNQGWSHF